MKTMLIFIAIVLAGILAKPLFDAIVSLPFPTSGKYDPQGGGDGYGIAIIGFIVTPLLLAVFLTALIVAALKYPMDGYLPGYGQQSFSYLQYIRQFILLKSIQIINLRKINLNCMKCLQTERLMKK